MSKPKYPAPTDWDKEQVFKRLPCVKQHLIDDLKAMGWSEKWIRHFLWHLSRREHAIYQFHGIIKKV